MQQGSQAAASTANDAVQSAQEIVSEAASAASSSGTPHRSLVFASKGGRAVVEPPQGNSLFEDASFAAEMAGPSSMPPASAALPAVLVPDIDYNSVPESMETPPEVTKLKSHPHELNMQRMSYRVLQFTQSALSLMLQIVKSVWNVASCRCEPCGVCLYIYRCWIRRPWSQAVGGFLRVRRPHL